MKRLKLEANRNFVEVTFEVEAVEAVQALKPSELDRLVLETCQIG